MSETHPVIIAQQILRLFRTEVRVTYDVPLGQTQPSLWIIANHRSFLDAPVLFGGLGQAAHLICHYYLGQVPLLNRWLHQLGGIYLGASGQSWAALAQAQQILQQGQRLAIFPEGGQRMTHVAPSSEVASFGRGFAHLALRSGIENLALVPIALVSRSEQSGPLMPLALLRLFDGQEPMFQQAGWHPYVVYERVQIMVGAPRYVTGQEIWAYEHGQASQITRSLAAELTELTRDLTQQGYQIPW